jgi:PAS domain S-box-containing protein
VDRRTTGTEGVSEAVENAVAGPRSRLPRVLHEVPAAVLLVDLDSRAVVHANPAARQLVGASLDLPVTTAVWSLAARLTGSDGAAYGSGDSPVERAAEGQPVFGEPLLVPTDAGTRPLWATAVPLPGPTDQALVVLFEVDVAHPEALIRDRAVIAAGLSFTIADPRAEGVPLVYVNPAFERTTGYRAEEVVGRNCRFLQGPQTDPGAVTRIKEALDREEHLVITLLNYRKDGSAFWNELSLSPVYDARGSLTHVVGIQADVTTRVHYEQEMAAHLLAEQAARAEAEKSRERLALLAEATSLLAATLDVDESLDRLTSLVVPALADFCTIDLLDGAGVRRVSSLHVDPSKAELLRIVEELQPHSLSSSSATAGVLQGGDPVLIRDMAEGWLDDRITDPRLVDAYRQLDIQSAVIVPLKARATVLGVLGLFTTSESGRVHDEADLGIAADLARRAGLTVDNARLYQREHDVAEKLQNSMLPTIPEVAGLQIGKRYLPSHTAGEVGGDWYDVLPLPDGRVGLAIGDVMGHDIAAAASMGQLRSVLRSYAWQGDSPSMVLDHMDDLVQGLGMAQLATALYARLDLTTLELCYANAGHLPPAVRRPDGSVRFLRGAQSVLVGAIPAAGRTDETVVLERDSVLVLYTDGLVEDRERDLDDGLVMLADALRAAPLDAEGICDAVTTALSTSSRADDVALLVVKVL